MEECFEYLGCLKKDCIMHGRKDKKRCWEVEGTLCNHAGILIMREKMVGQPKENICAASRCIYYAVSKISNDE